MEHIPRSPQNGTHGQRSCTLIHGHREEAPRARTAASCECLIPRTIDTECSCPSIKSCPLSHIPLGTQCGAIQRTIGECECSGCSHCTAQSPCPCCSKSHSTKLSAIARNKHIGLRTIERDGTAPQAIGPARCIKASTHRERGAPHHEAAVDIYPAPRIHCSPCLEFALCGDKEFPVRS